MPHLRYLRDAALFAPCYIALDWASYIAPLGPFNITPWNPQPALAIAWMLLSGLHHAPIVLLTVFGADLLIRQAPAGYLVTLATSAALASGYVLMAWALRSLPRFDRRLRSTRDLALFTAVALAGTAAGASLFVGILEASGLLPGRSFAEAWVRFSVGDFVGVLVTAPLLLLAADLSRREEIALLLRRPESLAQLVALAATLWLVFEGIPGDPARHFYLLFIPVIWVALRAGMTGAVAAIAVVQLGVVIGIHRDSAAQLPLVELQAIVATLTLTGLFLGVMVDERRRTALVYRETLRLAAAGEMAGAIAHEVNQPLTAVANYGQAAQMMLAAGADPAQVAETVGKMLGQAQRAAEVVRRLRDFFRTGTTHLEELPVESLLGAARRIGEQVASGRPVEFVIDAESGLPPLYVDRVQVELVLRNLIANAVEAVGAGSDARVHVHAARNGTAEVRVVVADNGPGLAGEATEKVFEPFVSGKPTGLGLGLAISRAIAEAHGGSLDARAGSHGEFHLVLPCHTPT